MMKPVLKFTEEQIQFFKEQGIFDRNESVRQTSWSF